MVNNHLTPRVEPENKSLLYTIKSETIPCIMCYISKSDWSLLLLVNIQYDIPKIDHDTKVSL